MTIFCASQSQEEALVLITRERDRQDEKWGTHFHHHLGEKWAVILGEEYGEVCAALQGDGNLKEELSHVAAVATSWLEDIIRNE